VANVAKAAFNSGQEHITPRGLHRKARELKPPCGNKCNRCARCITPEERLKIHQDFWQLSDINRKRDYITRHIRSSKPQTTNTLSERCKNSIRTYFFTIDNEEVRVCKTMFLNTLGVVDCWIETALKCCQGGNGMSPDKRGRHTNRPLRLRENSLELVREHINSFPRVHSHYTRERSKREYLESEVRSVENMHRLFKDWCSDKGIEKIPSVSAYRKVFNREFNIGFFVPRKDQCELCNRWKNALNHEERKTILQEYMKHLNDKKAVSALKKADKKSASATKCVACFDLQKVLNCPSSQVSLFFYKNKVSLYNFTIFDLRLKEGHCYLWDETIAQKGSNEVGTNVFQFVQAKVQEGIKEFVFYSDGPSGQNRNRMVFSMYMIASQKFQVKITHRFLESGHSYSEADSMHARIEDQVRNKNIYSVQEWLTEIQSAKKSGEAYIIHELKNEDVYDLHYLVDKQNWAKDSENQQVKWSKVREVSVSHNNPNVVMYRYNFEVEPISVNITMKHGENDVDLQYYMPPVAYMARFPLKPNKAKDIQWLMDKSAIPTKYHQFYREILSLPQAVPVD